MLLPTPRVSASEGRMSSASPYGDAPGHVCLAVIGAAPCTRTIETGEGDRALNMDLFARQLLKLFDEVLHAPDAPL